MTAVFFKFQKPDGEPVVGAPFTVTLRKPSFDEQNDDGILLPGAIEGITDAEGKCTLDLAPGYGIYYLSMVTPGAVEDVEGCMPGLHYKFIVPEDMDGVRVEDLIVTNPTWSRPWDEQALAVIIDAKNASQEAATNSRLSSEASAASATSSAQSAQASQTSAGTAAQQASDASASAQAAAGSATAANASKNAAAASAQDSAASGEQSRLSAVNAGNSATAAAQSATQAGTAGAAAGTTAGTAAANAVVANKQDKHVNLTAFSGLVGAVDKLPYFTGVGALALATLTSKARELLTYTTEAQMLAWMSGENTNPLGGTGSTDLNTLRTKRTDYYIVSGTNTPTGANGYLTVVPLAGTTECYQRYVLVNGEGTYERIQLSGNWGLWVRSISRGDFGLGAAGANVSNWTTSFLEGCGWTYGNANLPGGTGESINAVVMNMFLNAGPIGAQLMAYCGDNQLKFRTAYIGFGAWNSIFHTGNATRDPSLVDNPGLMFYGTNVNGDYWKYANGQMICRFKRGAITGPFPATARYQTDWTFPAAFAAPPKVSTTGAGRLSGVVTACVWQTYGATATAATCAVQPTAAGSTIDDLRDEDWLAVGRWK